MKLNSVFYSGRLLKLTMLGLVMTIVLLFNACKKDDVEYTPTIAALSVVNASPNSTSVDFYIENQKVNTNALAFGEKIEYQRVYQGNRGTVVTAAGSQTPLLSKTIALQGGEYHSLYIVGKIDALDYVFLKDEVSDPEASKAKVRFMNLSPDAPALNMEITGETTTFTDLAYKGYTSFKNVNAALSTITLKNKATGDVVATLTNVDLKSGKIYTVWSKGLVNTTVDAQKLTIQVTQQG